MATYIPYAETGYFSKLVLDYLSGADYLKEFYNLPPTIDSFEEQITRKEQQFCQQQRDVLHKVLAGQHANLKTVHPKVKENIELLRQADTFTITTGHQICLFTGPLYFIYKIITAIRCCEELKKRYPQYNFVPVYWMATEDHDFEEVNHFRLFGKTYAWNTNQTGAVGRFSTEGLGDFFKRLPERMPLFEEPYLQHSNLADATRELVHRLFAEYGVVSLDADNPDLKRAFLPAAEQDLLQQISQRKVHEVTERLAAYVKMQVNARPINLFYLKDNLRERIEQDGEVWKVLNTNIQFTKEALLAELQNHPERFSPNVILRPLYQEMVLPNLAYIGGGAEVAYWLEFKNVFAHFQVPFPVVMLRNSAMYIPASLNKRLEKLQLSVPDLFTDAAGLRKKVLARVEGFEEISLESQQKKLADLYEQLKELATKLDSTLIKSVAAAEKRTSKDVARLEKKFNRASERKHSTLLNQLDDLLEQLFPGGVLQERKDNVAGFMLFNRFFVDQMKQAFDPFGHSFTIVKEQE